MRNWRYTLPKTNIAPENGWLEYKFPLWMAHFSGAMLVSGRVNDPYKWPKIKMGNCGCGALLDSSSS